MSQLLLHPFRGGCAAVGLLLAASVMACGGGSTAPVKVAVATVDVTPAGASKGIGDTQQYTAIPRDAAGAALTDRVVAWLTSNSGVASITSSGLVTGVSAGTSSISAAVEGKTGTVTITIAPPAVATVTVNPPTSSIKEGATSQLTAVAKTADGVTLNGRATTWESATMTVATVGNTGIVTGVAVGTSVITATVEGKTATSTVTVTSNPCFHGTLITLGETKTGTLQVGDCDQLYNDNSLADLWGFRLDASTNVTITVTSTEFPTYIRWERSPSRTLISEGPDLGGNPTATLSATVGAGEYFVWANSFTPSGAGAYSVTVKTTGSMVAPVQVYRVPDSRAIQLRGIVPIRR